MLRHAWLILLAAMLLQGCSSLTDEDKTKGWSQQKLWTEASDALNTGNWEKAIEYFEKLQGRYPFGKYTSQAQINVAYAYYRFEEPDSAIAAAERFIRLHPQDPGVAYALYLKGLANFEKDQGFFSRLLPTDKSQRDAGAALKAYEDFGAVIKRFPNSKYAEDAAQRMLYLRNNLARHEINVADYYLRRGAYVAAAKRAEHVVANYQRTPAVRDALEVMVVAYGRLGMDDLVADTRRVIELNKSNGALIADPRDFSEKSWGRKVWEFFRLDQN